MTLLDDLQRWLDERLGPGHGRRPAVIRPDRIVLSKVEPGLPERVLDAVERVPVLFDGPALRAVAPSEFAPVDAWVMAVRAITDSEVRAGHLTPAEASEVMAGVESVGALLAACCWSYDGAPGWRPEPAEQAALDEVEQRLAHGTGNLFTRHYGVFNGRAVENHCPGASIARRLFTAARQFLEADTDARAPACPGGVPPVPS
ncbi:MAG: hypothetical protein KatS3mg062_0316 [Tepidiforma sp.]|nr:MAG: hypothetical protein KatS3mg062_0316 [Tepidiforma sp.]